jgi:hypothetical protein
MDLDQFILNRKCLSARKGQEMHEFRQTCFSFFILIKSALFSFFS